MPLYKIMTLVLIAIGGAITYFSKAIVKKFFPGDEEYTLKKVITFKMIGYSLAVISMLFSIFYGR